MAQDLFDWILGSLAALFSAVMFDMHKHIEKQQDDLSAFKEHVAREYAAQHQIEKMDEKLDRIIEMLHRKQDRPN